MHCVVFPNRPRDNVGVDFGVTLLPTCDVCVRAVDEQDRSIIHQAMEEWKVVFGLHCSLEAMGFESTAFTDLPRPIVSEVDFVDMEGDFTPRHIVAAETERGYVEMSFHVGGVVPMGEHFAVEVKLGEVLAHMASPRRKPQAAAAISQ